MDFFSNASIVLAAIVSAFGVLSVVAGGAWWMSSIYAEVRGIRGELKRLNDSHDREITALWVKMDSHVKRIDEHEGRIIRLESRQ